jgi:large subunit ribosomal protein L13
MDHIIDAKGKKLGRLATQIAGILQGKHSAAYSPEKVSEDRVLIKNADKIEVSGNKMNGKKGKTYYHHTGYMGHLKETSYEAAFAKDPKKVLRETVRHMLPKNFLNTPRLKHLVFINEDHAGE